MSDRRRKRVGLGIGLVALLAVLILIVPPGRRVPVDQRLTTLRTSPDGAGALYELLDALDIPVDRRMTPLDGPTPIGDALALLAPTQPLTPTEQDSLVRWLERGGTLFAAPRARDPLLRLLGLERNLLSRPAVERNLPDAANGGWGRPVGSPLTRGVDSVGTVRFVLAVTKSTPLKGVEPLVFTGRGGGAGDVARGGYRYGDGIIVLRGRLGKGTVVLVSDHRVLSNGRIGESGVAPILARAAAEAAAPGSPLVFDEYHHGHRGGTPTDALFGFLFGSPVGWLLLQLALVAGLAVLPAAVRFGAPVLATTAARRSPLEHVAALGEVYRQARTTDLARRRLLVGFARRLGRERPPPGGEAEFLARIGRGAPAGAEAVAAVAGAWEQRLPVRELAERIDRALERLNRMG